MVEITRLWSLQGVNFGRETFLFPIHGFLDLLGKNLLLFRELRRTDELQIAMHDLRAFRVVAHMVD